MQLSDWDKMQRMRERVLRARRINVHADLSYDFGANGRLYQFKLRNLGDMRRPAVPAKSDGPYLVLTRAYPFRQAPSDDYPKGRLMPITVFPLFSVTSKMSCLSYSLPAGPLRSLGSCQMAQQRTAVAALRTMAENDPMRHELSLQFSAAQSWRGGDPLYICNMCYAGKANYAMYSDDAMKATWRLAWTKAMLKRRGGQAFVDAIVGGIRHFGALSPARLKSTQGINAKYFRWHDAGDIFSFAYWEAIKEIARQLPRVRFWVPTRQWVSPRWREQFQRDRADNTFPSNLIVRPSALFVDAPAPRIDELAAGTLVTTQPVGSLRVHRQAVGRPFEGPSEGILDPAAPRRAAQRLFPERRVVPVGEKTPGLLGDEQAEVWDCPAYLGDESDTRSCMAQNCRVCWQRPDVEVGYNAH